MSAAFTKSLGSRQLLMVKQCRNLPKNNLSRFSKAKKIVSARKFNMPVTCRQHKIMLYFE